VADARRYQPLIHQILVSCKFQPEVARLDERLVFDWMSGVESDHQKCYKSEAIMYELVMCIVCEGLGKAGVATETSVAGEFAAASREYAAAAGIFSFLADDHLPKWVARGSNVTEDDLPVECCVDTARGLTMLFKANGQQMAIATVLIKPGTPNYSLVAKLSLGIVELLEGFITHMRVKAFKQMARIEKDFFTLVTFQIQLQKALSLYFYGRSLWETEHQYGLAIAFLSEATLELKTRSSETGKGVPEVSKIPALRGLHDDLIDLRGHMNALLKSWEKDNSNVYFEPVPQVVPAEKRLEKGIQLNKEDKYVLKVVEPLLLSLTDEAMTRSDSDLARELQERLNSGLDD
jgi:BRO1-like domain